MLSLEIHDDVSVVCYYSKGGLKVVLRECARDSYHNTKLPQHQYALVVIKIIYVEGAMSPYPVRRSCKNNNKKQNKNNTNSDNATTATNRRSNNTELLLIKTATATTT